MMGGEIEMADRSANGRRRSGRRKRPKQEGCFDRCLGALTGQKKGEISQEQHQREWEEMTEQQRKARI